MKSAQDKFYSADELHRYGLLRESREIFLNSALENTDGDPGVDYRMATTFIKNLRLLELDSGDKPIIIHQNSIGGDWCDGMAIFDAIQHSICPIIVITHGIAASMGSIIP